MKNSTFFASAFGATLLVLLIGMAPEPEPVPLTAEQKARLQQESEKAEAERQARAKRRNPEKYVEITSFNWSKTGFGSVMEARFNIYNPLDFDVKDIEITCRHSANSGTVIDRNTRTIYEIIPARSSRYFNDFNMGFIHSQAERSQCEITSATAL